MKGLLIAASLLIILTGCQKKSEESGNLLAQIPWPTSPSDFKLQDVPVNEISSTDPFRGRFATFTVGPKIDENAMHGASVTVNHIKSGNVIIPRDDISTEALTVYAHFQRLHALDKKVGITQLRWPRRVGLRVLTVGQDSQILQDNALYYEPLDAMFLVPYSQSGVPMAMNGGILAHEHFHAIFNKLVMGGLRKNHKLPLWVRVHGAKPTRVLDEDDEDFEQKLTVQFNNTVLRGMNEGFADFWGWFYTRDDQFITRTLSGAERRALNGDLQRFPSMGKMSSILAAAGTTSGEAVVGFAYEVLTTRYSRFLRRLAEVVDTPEKSGAQQIAEWIVETLPSMSTVMINSYEKEKVSPVLALKKIVDLVEVNKEEACELYQNILAQTGEIVRESSEEGEEEKEVEIVTEGPQPSGCEGA